MFAPCKTSVKNPDFLATCSTPSSAASFATFFAAAFPASVAPSLPKDKPNDAAPSPPAGNVTAVNTASITNSSANCANVPNAKPELPINSAILLFEKISSSYLGSMNTWFFAAFSSSP